MIIKKDMNECIVVFSLWEKDEREHVMVGLGEKKGQPRSGSRGSEQKTPPTWVKEQRDEKPPDSLERAAQG